jgi:hypothetical protein
VRALERDVYAADRAKKLQPGNQLAITASTSQAKDPSSTTRNKAQTSKEASQSKAKAGSHQNPQRNKQQGSKSKTPSTSKPGTGLTWTARHNFHIPDYLAPEQCDARDEELIEMARVNKFRCSYAPNARVFSLCVTYYCDRQSFCVFVSFERCWLSNKPPLMHFCVDGTSLGQWDKKSGMMTLKHLPHKPLRKILCIGMRPLAYEEGVFTKCGMHSVQRKQPSLAKVCDYALFVRGPAAYHGTELRVVGLTDLYIVLETAAFYINVGRLRAADTDHDESASLLVVVEESEMAGQAGRVLLYACPFPNPVHTYTPPRHLQRKYRPTDVSFFTLGGVCKLLVADEGNDAVHVLDTDVNELTLTFSHLLSTNCELRQPTALTSDSEGRLWVACKGGNIVALKEANIRRARTLANKWAERESDSVCLDFVKWLVLGLLLLAFSSGLLYIVSLSR